MPSRVKCEWMKLPAAPLMVHLLLPVEMAVKAGKAIYCEKPTAHDLASALERAPDPHRQRRVLLSQLQTGFEELTWGNVLPTRSEQEALLRQAGFPGEIQRSLVGEGFTVLTAAKP